MLHLVLEIMVACSLTVNQPFVIPPQWEVTAIEVLSEVRKCTFSLTEMRCQGKYRPADPASKLWLKRTIADGETATTPVGCTEMKASASPLPQ